MSPAGTATRVSGESPDNRGRARYASGRIRSATWRRHRRRRGGDDDDDEPIDMPLEEARRNLRAADPWTRRRRRRQAPAFMCVFSGPDKRLFVPGAKTRVRPTRPTPLGRILSFFSFLRARTHHKYAVSFRTYTCIIIRTSYLDAAAAAAAAPGTRNIILFSVLAAGPRTPRHRRTQPRRPTALRVLARSITPPPRTPRNRERDYRTRYSRSRFLLFSPFGSVPP